MELLKFDREEVFGISDIPLLESNPDYIIFYLEMKVNICRIEPSLKNA